MDNSITSAVEIEEASPQDLLEHLARKGARTALQAALEEEVDQFLQRFGQFRDHKGHRMAVRNGYLPERSVLSGIGPLAIRQPRVDDRKLRKAEGGERFSRIGHWRRSPGILGCGGRGVPGREASALLGPLRRPSNYADRTGNR